MMLDLDTSLRYCTFCPKLCRQACPVSTATSREILTPQQKMATMGHLRAGEIDVTVENADALYGCTGCGACTTACHHGITPGLHLMTGRAEAERAGVGHHALDDLPERVHAKALAATHKSRAAVAPERVRAEAEVAFLPSCDAPDAALQQTLTLLDRLGAGDVGLAATTLGCGGYPLLAGGFPERFRLHAEAVARDLRGHRRVVVDCPACAWAMKHEYPARGVVLAPEVVHTVELLAELDGNIAATAATGAAFYHDPCYLGRWQGLYDAPRKLLAHAVAEVREFSRARDEAECCGGGGVLPETMPVAADAIAERRLVEVRESDARTVVTPCATCRRQLARPGVTVKSLVEVLEEATRPKERD